MTLAFERNVKRVQVNRRVNLGQRSFRSKVTHIHTHTHTQWTECSTWTSKVVGK